MTAMEFEAAATRHLLDHLEALLDLRRRVADDCRVGIGRRAIHVALVREELRRAPQQLNARLSLLRGELLDDLVKDLLALRDRLT